jgi:hypothetical protein
MVSGGTKRSPTASGFYQLYRAEEFAREAAGKSSSVKGDIISLCEGSLGDRALEARFRQFDVHSMLAQGVDYLRNGDRAFTGMFLQLVQDRRANLRRQPLEEASSVHGIVSCCTKNMSRPEAIVETSKLFILTKVNERG